MTRRTVATGETLAMRTLFARKRSLRGSACFINQSFTGRNGNRGLMA